MKQKMKINSKNNLILDEEEKEANLVRIFMGFMFFRRVKWGLIKMVRICWSF